MERIIILSLLFINAIFSYGQADQKIAEMINREDFIQMSRDYPSLKDSISNPMLELMAEVGMNCAFNKPEEALELLDSLLNGYINTMDFNTISNFVFLTASQLSKLGNYENAASVIKSLVDVLPDVPIFQSEYNKY